jgi:hypothetical protein
VKNLMLLSLLIISHISLARDYEDMDKRASGNTGYVNANGEAFEYIPGIGHRKINFDKVREEQMIKEIEDVKSLLASLTEPKSRGKAKSIVDETRKTAQKALEDLESERAELSKKIQSASK